MDQFIIIELIVSLLLIVILGYFILKKRKGGFRKKGNNIQELERFNYTPNTFLSLIIVNEDIFLIGVSDASISILKEFENREIKENILKDSVKNDKSTNFKDFFAMHNQENSKKLKDKLKKMRK